MKPIRIAVAAGVALALALSACGGSKEAETGSPSVGGSGAPDQHGSGQQPDRKLTIFNSYKVASLDPIRSGANWLFDWGIAENLLQVDEAGKIQPWLAETVTKADDTHWNIALKRDLTFQNGKKVDAKAVAAALNRQVKESKASQIYLDAASLFEPTGELTLTLTTPEPNAMVPAALASRDNGFQVYDAEVVTAAKGDSTKIMGKGAFTGPYAIKTWTAELLEMDRYDGYWAGKPAMSAVTVKVVPDEQARIAGVQSGQADLAFYPSPDAKLALDGRSDAYFRASDLALQALLVDMNLTAPPFDDARVRKAFIASVDFAELSEKVANGVFDTATGLYPAAMSYAVANEKQDGALAGKLLDEAGWMKGAEDIRTKDGKPLVVRFVTQAQGPETLALATAMQAEVRKTGFDLQINNAEDSAKVKSDMSAWDSSIGLNGSLSGTADPVQPFLSRWTTGGPANAQKLSDPALDAIGAKLRVTFEAHDRDELLKQAQKLIVADNGYVFAATFKRFLVVTSAAWKNYTVSNVRAHLRWNTAP